MSLTSTNLGIHFNVFEILVSFFPFQTSSCFRICSILHIILRHLPFFMSNPMWLWLKIAVLIICLHGLLYIHPSSQSSIYPSLHQLYIRKNQLPWLMVTQTWQSPKTVFSKIRIVMECLWLQQGMRESIILIWPWRLDPSLMSPEAISLHVTFYYLFNRFINLPPKLLTFIKSWKRFEIG